MLSSDFTITTHKDIFIQAQADFEKTLSFPALHKLSRINQSSQEKVSFPPGSAHNARDLLVPLSSGGHRNVIGNLSAAISGTNLSWELRKSRVQSAVQSNKNVNNNAGNKTFDRIITYQNSQILKDLIKGDKENQNL